MILSVNKTTMTAKVRLYRGGDDKQIYDLSWWSMNPALARVYGKIRARVFTLPIKEVVDWFDEELYIFDLNHPYVFGRYGEIKDEILLPPNEVFAMNVRNDTMFRIGEMEHVCFVLGSDFVHSSKLVTN